MASPLEQAKVHLDRREWVQCASQCMLHLNTDFHDETALWMLGTAHLMLENYGLSAALNRQALEIRRRKGGNFSEALNNLAACFKNTNNPKAAFEVWQMAYEVEKDEGDRARILSNIAGCHINRGMPEKAMEYYHEAEKIRPDLLTCQYNKAFALLELGQWKEGWDAFHNGFKSGDRKHRQYGKGNAGKLPDWDGTPGQRVIVWGEQGIGDEILFSTCIPDLIKVSEKVIIDCHPRLTELFKRSFPMCEVHGTRKTLSEIPWLETCDAEASVCVSTLPKFFRTRDEDFPGTPYLIPRKHIVASERPRIGISWTGGSPKTAKHLRSIPLKAFEPVLRAIDADWYSLQYTDDAARDVCQLEEDTGVRVKHYPGWVQCQDYDKTAEFVAGLDLTITVCTAMHHLSNAIGVPTWTLVPSQPAWRYARKGELWYSKTCRFFRQGENESWAEPIERVAAAVRVKHGLAYSEAAE